MSEPSSAQHENTRTIIRWLAAFLSPYKKRAFAAVFFLCIGSLSWLALGQAVKLVVDEGFLSRNAAELNKMVMVILAITVVSGIATFCRFYLMTWLGERVSADIRKAVYHHLLTLSQLSLPKSAPAK